MANSTLTLRQPLEGFDKKVGDMHLKEVTNLSIVSIAVPLKGATKLKAALKAAFDVAMPKATASTLSKNKKVRLMQSQADQLFCISSPRTENADVKLAKKLGGTGYCTDQTDAWVALSLAGPSARAALERICQLDLDARAFKINDAARTSMEHLGSIIIRTGADEFLLLAASSSADSFLHAVELSAQNVS